MRAFFSDQSRSSTPIDRRSLLAYAGAALAVLATLAGTPVAQAAGASDPTVPIQQLDAALLAAMKAGQNTPFGQRYALLNPAVEQAFDLNALLRAAVGFSWVSMQADQKTALASAFERYTVSNYVANFDSYDGQSFRVLPETRQLPNGEVIVRTQITRLNKSPVEIDYVMRMTVLGWKAVDVLTDGTISQVAVQRSDFVQLLSSGGASALRAGLQRKVASLSNGALA
jgi:phospholipid transport system substrate-binding protein